MKSVIVPVNTAAAAASTDDGVDAELKNELTIHKEEERLVSSIGSKPQDKINAINTH